MIIERELEILTFRFFPEYIHLLKINPDRHFAKIRSKKISLENFNFYHSVSAVFSSKTEGEPIELDSYLKHKLMRIKFRADYTKRTDDLFDAYEFARKNKLTLKNFLTAHSLLSHHLLPASGRGKIRNMQMVVMDEQGKIEYEAALSSIVWQETNKLFSDIKRLLTSRLNFNVTFYFASLIHIVFVKIHPFEDGNGRAARLLEKWFLAEKLGKKAWYIQSEKYYYKNRSEYYKNVNIGERYENIDLKRCIPFLLMLPQSFKM